MSIDSSTAARRAVCLLDQSHNLRQRGVCPDGGGAHDTVVFDKTGTLTRARMRVTDVIAGQRRQPNQVLRLAAAVESGSEHPIGAAIVAMFDRVRYREHTHNLAVLADEHRGAAALFLLHGRRSEVVGQNQMLFVDELAPSDHHRPAVDLRPHPVPGDGGERIGGRYRQPALVCSGGDGLAVGRAGSDDGTCGIFLAGGRVVWGDGRRCGPRDRYAWTVRISRLDDAGHSLDVCRHESSFAPCPLVHRIRHRAGWVNAGYGHDCDEHAAE